jgi:hypothetical protein
MNIEIRLACWKKGIFIYPKPISKGGHIKVSVDCRIVVEQNKEPKIGKIIFKQNQEMYNKIEELYNIIYKRIK